jgi:4-hydroxy-tetrahydrodipicolinate synthase
VVRHFAAIAAAADGRPIVAYNIPQRVVVNLEPDAIARLAREVPQVVAVKQATTAIDQARAIVELGLALYAGNDDLLLPFLEIGGCGGICVASHLIGVEMGRICDLVAAGDLGGARDLDAELRPVLEALSVTTNPIPLKAALALSGHRVGGLRLPLVEASESELAAVRGMPERRGLLARL